MKMGLADSLLESVNLHGNAWLFHEQPHLRVTVRRAASPGAAGFELGTGKGITEEVHPGTMTKAALALEVFSHLESTSKRAIHFETRWMG